MNSQGNDFIIIDIATEVFEETHDNITKICSRENIGCDQLLLINTSNLENVACKIYNSDGTSACQCGNGLRAVMLYLKIKFSITKSTIKVCAKDYNAQIIGRNKISVDLGKPIFLEDNNEDFAPDYGGFVVDVGNKHFVIMTRYIGIEGSVIYSKDLDHHSERLNKLQSKYNLTFVLEGALGNVVRIKVKERGAGWTKSCGSGAIAAAACSMKTENLGSPIIVEQDGGTLEVHFDDSESLKLVGPSEFEYDGVWDG